MSDGQKQAVTVALILVIAVLICGGAVAGVFLLTGGAAELVTAPTAVISPKDGVLITAVLPESPAAQANLQSGHVLLQLNGDAITSPELLTLMLTNLPADAQFSLLVRDEAGMIWQTTAVRAADPPYLGVEVVPLPQQTPRSTTTEPGSTPTESSVPQLPVITGIVPDSPAANLDVQIGDIVTAVDGAAILNGEELLNAVAGKLPGDSIMLTLRRGAETLLRTAVLASHPEDDQRAFLGIQFQPLR